MKRFVYGLIPLLSGPLACGAHAEEAAPKPASCCAGATRAGMLIATSDEGKAEPPAGMVWIPPGEFTMGSDAPDTWGNEHPAHRVRLDGFWMDATEVTNAQFAAFVETTGYVTLAERPVDWGQMRKQIPPGTPKPPDEMLAPGSVVFTPPDHPVPQNNFAAWWSWTPQANWRQPKGPGSTIDGLEDHPVVHVAWEDAKAYADWAGKQLPTEAQWEYAARGGREGTRFDWGDEFRPEGNIMANTWDGTFPHRNTQEDGFVTTAPVRTFPANGFGLYDMAGNVWEWTADWYRDDMHQQLAGENPAINPSSPESPSDAANPGAPSRVVKGGSFLCHVDYCESYRPSARRGLPVDTSLQHTGFRCIIVSAPEQAPRTQ
jgi:formylglycine-generating enzyme required for sulfatase activity